MCNSHTRPPHILIVDDKPENRYFARRVLANAGFEVSEAGDGSEALQSVRSRPDLVLLDVHLPDTTGFEVCRAIKGDPELRSIPVLHLSASFIRVEDQVQGLNTGADAYLTQPVEPAVLIATIRALLRARAAEEQLIRLNQTLESQVAQRTAVAEKRAAQLRELAVELTQAEQRERRRLARLLHDHLQQLLAASRMRLAAVRHQLQDPKTQKAVEAADELLAQAIEASRSLSMQLSPPVLYERGLGAALEWFGKRLRNEHGLTVHVRTDEQVEALAQDLRAVLFESARELLFNVVKHARVDQANVTVGRTDQNVELLIEDRGAGCDPATIAAAESGFGLATIRRRIEFLGGTFALESSPGQGTRARLSVPFRAGQTPSAVTT